ncbi:hypothetical protein OESDEN_16378 [Oesophagostomum dentatum]|uniref:Uncharacterized protein n=1 Tax=Oesophagostomum dentatum TaxID=61180 RepID=A0A0B1SL06_OESDE|nr:hypothetical protein OESDEN_16378 [Oesophagostomum dentatum]
MAAAGDAANMQMMYNNGTPGTPIYGGAEYSNQQPTQQPHDSPPIAQGLFTPSPQHHGTNPQESTNETWSSILKKELEQVLPNKKDLNRKTIVFCDDAVNVKAVLKDQSKERGDVSSPQVVQDAASGDCKYETPTGFTHRFGTPARNLGKRPPRRPRSGGRFVRASTRAVMSLNGQFQSMRVSNEHPKNPPSEALRTSGTPPESPQF